MHFHINELGFRFVYCLFSFICRSWCFLFWSSVWLEFFVISFHNRVSGVFFCLSALITSRVSVSLFLAFLFGVPFFLFQIGCYFFPSFYLEEQVSFFFIYFVLVFNFLISLFIWWLHLLPLLYTVFVIWFRNSGLAITYIPEVTALIRFIFIILLGFILIFHFPRFIFAGIVLGFWDVFFLFNNRIKFYFFFVFIRTMFSPPDVLVQLIFVFILIFSFEFSLFISRFVFVSKVF